MQNTEILHKTFNKSPIRPAFVLGGCLSIVALVCVTQIMSNTALLLLCLVAFLLFMLWASARSYAFPVFLFFLPWSSLLKLSVGSISFYTIALLLGVAVSLVQSKMRIRFYQVALTALIMLTTLMGKVIHGNTIAPDYLVFMAMLLLFSCFARKQAEQIAFYEITFFFACGIISAAFIAGKLADFSGIKQYITVQTYLSVRRASGFYGDPNFYAAQISACLAGVQLLLSVEKNRKKQISLLVILVLLLYFGLVSASKTFVFVVFCMFLVWLPTLLGKHHFRLVLGLLCAGLIILTSTAFQSLFQIIADRFSEGTKLSGLTTGRTDIWKEYLRGFIEYPTILIFGEGYSAVNLGHKSPHNTLIQLVYQFGLIGLPFVIAWIFMSIRDFASQLGGVKIRLKYLMLMCVGVVLPWFALDIVQFDEFFIMPIYAVIGIMYTSNLQVQNQSAN